MKKLNILGSLLLAGSVLVGTGLSAVEVNAQESLVVYSNSLSDGRGDWLQAQAQEAGFDLEFVEAGGGEIYNRLLDEKAAPQADIAFGMDESFFLMLTDDELLASYEPTWASDLPEETITGAGYYYPLVEQHVFLMYNSEFIEEGNAPTNWSDLGSNEAFNGLYRAPSSLGGNTNQKAVLSLLLQYQDAEGDLGISDEGWEAVRLYLENAYELAEGEDTLALLADGTKPIDYWYSSGIPDAEETYSFTATPVVPESGVMTFREQVGVVNKGADADYTAAQEFVEWFGSAEVQGAWASEFGTIPVLPAAQESANPRIVELVSEFTPMEVDWAFVNENLNNWIEKIELELMPF